MPVISPRRSISSTSGSLYIPQTTSGTYSSSLTNKSSSGTGSSSGVSGLSSSSSSSSTSGYSSTYRSNGYTKGPSSSTYSNSSSFYPGSYLSRGTYQSSVGRSSYPSSALTGGSSALSSSYRASSYLSGGNNDTTSSSRFGRDLERKRATDNTDCNQKNNNSHHHTNSQQQRSSSSNRNSIRPSSSSYSSSSSLARLVATSALEIYEKYSPANYIPKVELSRSSSVSEGAASSATAAATATTTITTPTSSSSSSSLIRQRNNDNKLSYSNSISKISNSNNNSSNNLSKRSYNSRQTNGTVNENSDSSPSSLAYSNSASVITDTYITVPLQHSSSSHSSNGGGAVGGSSTNKLLLHVSYDLPDDSNNSLKDLKISSISPSTTNTTSTSSATTNASSSCNSSQDTKDTDKLASKQKRSVEAKTTTTSSSNNTNAIAINNKSTTGTATTTTTTTTSAKAGNQQFFLISAFKDQNFLKKECELARSQVSRSRQRFDNNNGIEDDNYNNNSDSGSTSSINNNNNNNTPDDRQFVNRNENGGSPLTSAKASSSIVHDNQQGVSSVASGAKNQSSIKPLIHRAPNSISNSRFLSSRLTASSTNNKNNNMHCLHSNSELLDDIKYIDSDETERQQQQQQQHQQQLRQHKPKLRPKSSIISSSNQSLLFEKVNPYKYQNGTLLSSSPPVSSSAPNSTTSTATSSPSSTFMGGRRCDTSSIKASIEKFNNLAEAKRLPTRCSTTNLQLSSNDFNDRRLPLRERSASPAASSSTATTTRGSSITSNLAASNSTSSGSIASNNLILRNRSTESSPSHSPKNLRKTSITQFSGGLHNGGSTSNLVKSIATYEKVTLTTVSMLSCPTPSLSTVTSRTISIDKKIPPAATAPSVSSSSCSSSPSNKGSDNDESVRSTSSLRSTLPPLPSNSTRDWDRDTSSRSSLLSSRNLNDDYSSSSSRKLSPEQEGLCGLRNIGNTCFMNSVIQCLSHTSELTKFLKTQNGVRSSSSKDQQILSEFAKLIREMWTSNTSSVTPSELKRAFSSKHRMYSDYNQQDAQEFLRFFLDSLHSALNSGVKGEILKIDESLSDNRKADITWEWYTKTENSVIRDLFVGQLKSTLKCTVCGNTSVTFDPVWDLSVPLPSSSRCKLEACLDLFIREEVLDGDEMPTCSKCQTRRKSTKSFTIQRFPKYLVIHLKRFSETRWSKMSNIVEFPTGERELNMGPYGSNSSSNVYYSLYAISNHMGSTAGGHYVALCKHPITKKWHEFNDNVVSSELTESHLVSSSAYILFYERAHRRHIQDPKQNTNVNDRAVQFLIQRKKPNFKREQNIIVFETALSSFPESLLNKSSAISQNTNGTPLRNYNYHSHIRQQQEPIFLLNVLLGIIFYAILFATCYYFFF